MASLWKHPKSPFWAACFTVYSTSGLERWKRSLKTSDRKLASRIADVLEAAGRSAIDEHEIAAFCEKISDARTKRATSSVCADVYYAVKGREIGAGSLRAFVDAWLSEIGAELAPQSHLRYKKVVGEFVDLIGGDSDRDVMAFGARDDTLVLRFRDHLAKRLSASSVNTALKIVRQMFKSAEQRYKIDNPARLVRGVSDRRTGMAAKRGFTLPEIGRIIRETRGSEWEGIVLTGLYTGQRLGDIATLRWETIDLQRRELALNSRKTNRRILIPLAGPLADHLLNLPTSDDPRGFVFPNAASAVHRAKAEQTGALSNQFHDILARAGLVRRRSHRKAKDGRGRSVRRKASEISFHSFRHSATSLLKNAGIPQSVVMDIIGHESKAISQVYTHVGEPEKRIAVDSLPSIATLLRAASASEDPSSPRKKMPKTRKVAA